MSHIGLINLFFKHMYSTWINAYLSLKETTRPNEQSFNYIVPRAWGDLDDVSNIVALNNCGYFNGDVMEENNSISNGLFLDK